MARSLLVCDTRDALAVLAINNFGTLIPRDFINARPFTLAGNGKQSVAPSIRLHPGPRNGRAVDADVRTHAKVSTLLTNVGPIIETFVSSFGGKVARFAATVRHRFD